MMTKPTLNPNLKDFWVDDSGRLRRARLRVLYGGRASTKSWEFAGRSAQIGQKYATRFLCVRRFQNKIKESVYTLIKNEIDRFDFGGYTILKNSIVHTNGTEFAFYGIERNVDEIKSFEGADILWIEEAHNLTAEQWKILEPTIRKEGSEIWVSFNPRLATDFAYKKFVLNPPANSIIRKINYPENPFLSKTLLESIEELKKSDPELYRHVYLGEPLANDDGAVIRRRWIEAAVDSYSKLNIEPSGAFTLGYDVADSGEDKNALAMFKGLSLESLEEWKGDVDGLEDSVARVNSRAQEVGGFVVYDSIGVGAQVGSTLNKLGNRNHAKFIAGGKVFKPNVKYAANIRNGEKFENLKAQAWQLVADMFRNTYRAVNGEEHNPAEIINISSDVEGLEQLITELSTPKKRYSKRSLDMVETKDELKARGIDSPNKADAFIMGLSKSLVKQRVSALQDGF